jgi:FkbM family methyltransferase
MHTLEDEMLQRPTYKTSSCLEVRTCRLDDEPLVDPIHFMKIDVEGHELEVLKGAIGILN